MTLTQVFVLLFVAVVVLFAVGLAVIVWDRGPHALRTGLWLVSPLLLVFITIFVVTFGMAIVVVWNA